MVLGVFFNQRKKNYFTFSGHNGDNVDSEWHCSLGGFNRTQHQNILGHKRKDSKARFAHFTPKKVQK